MKMQSQKIRLFSHLPGASAILPKTFWKVTAFPALFFLDGPDGEKIAIAWKLLEKIESFTLFQDLYLGEIEINIGFGLEHLRVFLKAEGEKIKMSVKKAPKDGIEWNVTTPFPCSQKTRLFSGEEILFDVGLKSYMSPSFERISLGVHKKMDVDLMRRRADLKEILPLWFLLSQWLPPFFEQKREGVALLLNSCEEKLAKNNGRELEKELSFLWQAGFSSLFVPHLVDEHHLGVLEGLNSLQGFDSFKAQKVSEKSSAFSLIKEGSRIIRSLFLQQEGEAIRLLPCKAPSFVSGILQQMDCLSFGLLDMQWRSYLPRKVHFAAKQSGAIRILCPQEIHSFRLRRSLQEKGRRVQCGESVQIGKGNVYIFDRFEK